jgi:hypothetical protein
VLAPVLGHGLLLLALQRLLVVKLVDAVREVLSETSKNRFATNRVTSRVC